jgi:hypothetical protein
MFEDKTFTGSLKKITQSGDFVTYVFKLSDGSHAFTFTGPKYRNYANWKHYKIGDIVDGLRWHDEIKKRIDADSPVHHVFPIEQCKTLLSTKTEFSDTMVEELRDSMYATAELAFEIYYSDVDSNGSKNPFGSLKVTDSDTSI